MTVDAGPAAFPPLEAFLIAPRFAVSDLWVWPLFVVVVFFWLRGYHKAAGLQGRDIDLLVGLRTLNGLFLWATIIALSRAVHRVTDDILVSGVWTGVTLALSSLAYKAILKYSPIAPVDQRARAAIDRFRAEQGARTEAKGAAIIAKADADDAAWKAERAAARAAPRKPPVAYHSVVSDNPADATRHVAALVRKDLFGDPAPPPEPAPEPEKPPRA